MKKVDFITMSGDLDRFDVLLLNSQNISKHHPNSTYWIYDTGLSEQEANQLSNLENIKIIKWFNHTDHQNKLNFIDEYLAKVQQYILDNVHGNHLIKSSPINFQSVLKKWDHFVIQKPYIIKDFTKKSNGNFVWLDDDAILINKLNIDMFDNFDVGVTVRSKYSELRRNTVPINAGVIFFNNDGYKVPRFTDFWINRMTQISPLEDRLREQTSMSELCLCQHSNPSEIKYNQSVKIQLQEDSIKIAFLPASKYNHLNLDYGIDPSEHKIVHFRHGGIKSNFNRKLISDALNGHLNNYYR